MPLDPVPDWPEPAAGLMLIAHPDTPARAVESVEVQFEMSPDGSLWLRYHIEVPENDLALPDPAGPERADGLWETTCCELFLRRPGEPGYLEFNFCPSSQWAAYRFSGYRDGAGDFDVLAPDILLDCSASHFALETTVELSTEWASASFIAALSAVIEESDGTKSYWALRHPPGKPDFHHPDCFALTLGAPESP
ncbi:MAG: DOMON-like domain-containing protein [Sphingopyxis sp.]|uniref:DOMON-like domain-containing protein n=1 Tax=Sphingopyxis sp. TaxID=1908224 RepID=UPI003D6C9DDD